MSETRSIWFWVSPDEAERAVATLSAADLTASVEGSRPDLVVIVADELAARRREAQSRAGLSGT
jgi:hypothetical protein